MNVRAMYDTCTHSMHMYLALAECQPPAGAIHFTDANPCRHHQLQLAATLAREAPRQYVCLYVVSGRAFAKPPQKRTFGGSNSRASFDALECPVGAG